MAKERRRKRDALLDGGAEVGLEAGASALAEFPPAAVVVGVAAGIGVLGFLAWKTLARSREKKNIG